RRHYLRRATTPNHWFDFWRGKLEEYVRQYGDDFCLVVYGGVTSDAYVMPYSLFKNYFCDANLDTNRPRWVGTIDNDQLRFGSVSVSLAMFRNRLDLLG